MKRTVYILFSLLMVTAMNVSGQQRRINPVKTPATITQSRNETKRDSIDRTNIVHMHDSEGNVILVDTLTGKEVIDSTAIAKVPPMIYPLFHSVSVGVDLWSPLMRLTGSKYGLIGFFGQVSLHNRYIPTVELGLGNAAYTPEDNNYTYRSPVSVYAKIGCDYNFLYNSNPDYYFYAGIRYGFSSFAYRLTDVTIKDNYWGETQVVDMPRQTSTAGYLELLIGIKVTLYKDWAMGWSLRYHTILHESSTMYGQPWYIPGYGTRGSSIGASLSLYYTLPFDKIRKKNNIQIEQI